MRNVIRSAVVIALTAGITPAYAQSTVATNGLGGYGALAAESGLNMGMNGAVIPYGGKFSGFMSYRMNSGSGSLSFQTRSNAAIGANRASFSLSPLTGRMSSMPRGTGLRSTYGLNGATGLVPAMPSMTGSRSTGVMPPSFGYPFRQPPSLLGTSGSSAGMSM